MTGERIGFIAVLVSAGLLCSIISFISWKRRSSAGRGAFWCSLCLAGVAVYNLGYALEIASDTLPSIMFWVRIEYWGVNMAGPAWLLFSLYLAGKERMVTKRLVAAIFVLPIVFLLAGQTLGSLNLMHHNPRINTAGPFPTFAYDRGILFLIGIIYESLYLAVSTVLFSLMLFRSAPAFRRQAAIFWTASLIPWAAAIVYNLGLSPYNIDLNPTAMGLSGVLLALGFLKFRFLDIVPLARDVVFDGMKDGILVLDTKNRVMDMNPSLSTILPGIGKAAVGRPATEALASYPSLLGLLSGKESGEVELETADPRANNFYRASFVPLFTRRGREAGKIISIYDHTQVKLLIDQLEVLATHDSLTGAYNRRYSLELASKELLRARRYGEAFSLIMIDVDNFKSVNDTFGHAFGDEALKWIVKCFAGMLRNSDSLGRYGGEEFIALLPETDPYLAAAIAERMKAALESDPMRFEGQSVELRASFGVTGSLPSSTQDLETLLRRADKALYRAKEEGRNRVCVADPI